MANNRKKRNTNQKPEEAKTQAPVTEEADHHALTITLRSLLFGTRKEAF